MIRLDKYLKDAGCGSRKEVGAAVKKGEVSVNGILVYDASIKVDEGCDTIVHCGNRVEYVKNYIIMLNKPSGYICATEDNLHKTVLELIKEDVIRKRVKPAGRLDIDTEGFVLLTDDGQLNHLITGPKAHIRKRYLVKTADPIRDEDKNRLESGLILADGYHTKEAGVHILDEHTCYLDIFEGKYHQVKRMLAAVGNRVEYLKRVMIGNLPLDEALKPGEYRMINKEEITLLLGGN